MKLDNFALAGAQTCPLWYKTRIIDHWTPTGKSAALGAGGAIHSGLAAWYSTRDPEAAVAAIRSAWPSDHPVDDYRTEEKCVKIMLEYMKNYTFESFTVIPGMVEIATTLPMGTYLPICNACHADNQLQFDNPNVYDPSTNECSHCGADLEPLEYGGIFDTLIDFNGQVYILEHKTTSQLGPKFFDQFKPNNQITGYVWLAKGLSGRCDGALVNAIGIMKSSATKFERHFTTRNQQELDDWVRQVWVEATHIQRFQLTGEWPMRSKACTIYGGCEFLQVHSMSDKDTQRQMLEQYYVQDPWEYEKRDA